MKFLAILCLALICVFIFVSSVFAEVPHLINYQGVLTDTLNNPIDGIHDLTFRIYPDSITTSSLWMEVHTGVDVEKGLFSVVLGSFIPFPASLFEVKERWLGITVDGDDEMSSRARITSVPWALRAAVAESALVSASGGTPWSAAGNDIYYNSGDVGIGTSTPESYLHIKTGDGAAFTGIKIDSDGEHSDTPFRIRTNSSASGFTDDDTKFYITGEGRMYLPHTMIRDGDLGYGGRLEIRPWNNRIVVWDNVNSMRLEIYHGNNDLDIALRAGGMTSWINGVNDGNVGIGKTNPQEQLDVDGTVQMLGFKMPTGAANGYVLTSDESSVGVGSYYQE